MVSPAAAGRYQAGQGVEYPPLLCSFLHLLSCASSFLVTCQAKRERKRVTREVDFSMLT